MISIKLAREFSARHAISSLEEQITRAACKGKWDTSIYLRGIDKSILRKWKLSLKKEGFLFETTGDYLLIFWKVSV